MKVMIIDYGMGNLRSVKRAFEECDADAFISDNPKDMDYSTHVILPGVGAFPDAMTYLSSKGWDIALNKISEEGIPLLGICLGMQLLAETGDEVEKTNGLGLIPGKVIKLEPDSKETRIPHVGWNEIYKAKSSRLFENIQDGADFYFVHSYHFFTMNENHIVTRTPYCGNFISSVEKDNVFGVQFHPEKSQKFGFKLIKNFIKVK